MCTVLLTLRMLLTQNQQTKNELSLKEITGMKYRVLFMENFKNEMLSVDVSV